MLLSYIWKLIKKLYLHYLDQNQVILEAQVPRNHIMEQQRDLIIRLYFDGPVRTTVRTVASETKIPRSTVGAYLRLERVRRLQLGIPVFNQ